jgi:3-dehydroquinate dehydratase/shikimate dehydrogenase
MGDMGIPSRILGAKFGAPFTYVAFNAERRVAPGIPSLEELHHVYDYERLNADTAVYGVVGDPVAHSLSPLIHNSAFRALGVNAVYVPFRVPREELAIFLKDFAILPVSGYSVTIPHKEEVADLAPAKDDPVTWIRAANTLVSGPKGFTAYNTDYQAALDSMLAHIGELNPQEPATLRHRSTLLLGAGGVARALAHLLHRNGAKLTITNRTYARAQELAEELGCVIAPWEGRHAVLCDLVVNATSVGMHPNVDESPLHASFFKPGMVVFDTVYTPETTLLVKEARARGCHVLTGVDMFVRQAALQFRLFTGQEPPLDVMRKVVKRALSPIKILSEET